MHSLSKPEQWSTFLNQYAQLYAQAAITEVRLGNIEQARTLLQNFARVSGKRELERYLQGYESEIPTDSDTLSEEELRANKDLVKRLEQLRRGL
jgi:hypothetical protein